MVTDEPTADPADRADSGPADETPPPNGARASREYGGARPQPFRALRAPRTWKRFVPLVGDLGDYDRAWLRTDVVAGVAIAALAVPQAMAYAQTAGMPVAAGLYGLLLPVVAYAAFGSSRLLMTGPTATAALLVAPAVAPLADDAQSYALLAAMLALVVGVVFALARVARLGWIADY
ncbi:MAG TPA: SulP family inorganic anion transporter, partial [Actinotalea sp.]|nr:SulP family inorganic anion transporter [Actinotalea sp.]